MDADRKYLNIIDGIRSRAESYTAPVERWGIWQRFGRSDREYSRWKVHVSIGLDHLIFLTPRLSDYLLKRGTAFKMIDTLANAEQLQCGGMGVLQIGKPITVYPLLEEDMGGLIGELRHLTKNACGLRAITDVAISDSSCLSLRNETWPRKTPTAEQLGQARSRFPDLLAPERVKVSRPERYVVVGRISVRGAGLRLKALDLDSSTADRVPRFVFIKEGRRYAERDVQGIDAYERLAMQCAIHEQLSGAAFVPALVDKFELDDSLFGVFTYIDGLNLERAVAEHDVSLEQILAQIARIVGSCHDAHILLNDLSPSNFVIEDGVAHIVDLNDACRMDLADSIFPRATSPMRPPPSMPLSTRRDYLQLFRLAALLESGESHLRTCDTDKDENNLLSRHLMDAWARPLLKRKHVDPAVCIGTEWS